MKAIIKFFVRGLLVTSLFEGICFGFGLNLYADMGDLDVSRVSLVSTSRIDDQCAFRGLAIDCAGFDKIALNGFTAPVRWELDAETPLSSARSVKVSDLSVNPEISSENESSIGLAAPVDSHPQVLAETAGESIAPLSLDGGGRDNAVNDSSDAVISEPLLASILALIAIVAVARRNVSGG